jgi:hydrogenase expression/formation protein HypC
MYEGVMCLAVPFKIVAIEGETATVDAEGVRMPVCLLLIQEAKVGDYVIVHAGFALEKIDMSQAMETLKMLRQATEIVTE